MNYLEGYNLAINNAKAKLAVARNSAEMKDFGTACSLCILSSIKASFLITKHYHPNTDIEDFEMIFKSHLIKHKHIKQFMALNLIFIKQMDETNKDNIGFMKTFEMLTKEQQKSIREKFDFLFSNIDWIEHQKSKNIDTNKMDLWLTKANDEKNNGLYVGRENGTWVTPRAFEDKDFDEAALYTETLIEQTEKMATLYNVPMIIEQFQKMIN